MAKKKQVKDKRWLTLLMIVGGLWFLSMALAGFFAIFSDDMSQGDTNVAVIKVHGPISVSGGGRLDSGASSSTIVELIEEADETEHIDAILVDINSPGGSAVASEEIATALKEVNKTTVALIREVGASGGFWVATAADHIVASPVSIAGSIGVISSYLEFSDVLDDYNVTYERLVAGKYKDMGSPFKDLTPQERILFQEKLDVIHDYFIESVADNRNMTYEEVKEHATGMIFTGREALELGFIDELGNKKTAQKYLEKELNTTVTFADFEPEVTWSDILSGVVADNLFSLGEGMGSGVRTREPIIRT